MAEKRVDFAYDAFGRTSTITRYADLAGTELVADTTFTFDSAGRLTELLHHQGTTNLAGYTWTYDSAGRITQFTSLLDGTVTYTHDATGQLTGADYDSQDDESYSYDENGNRTGGGYVVGPNNQLLSDGTFWYEYDPEGNRTVRYVWTDADTDGQVDPGERSEITEYQWDHRNRLVSVVERATDTGPATQTVEHTYDYLNRWVARSVDPDGDGPLGFVDTYFVYDGTPSGVVPLDRAAVTLDNVGQIVLQFAEDAQGTPQLANRYLWGPAVDQILADEQLTDPELEGDVLWALTDHLGTVRDLAHYDPGTSTTTVANHRVFTSFGRLVSETAPAVDHLFAFTARPLERFTGLQGNLNRWYDAEVGRWLSQDPIAFKGRDANLYRYCGNGFTKRTDPAGTDWLDSYANWFNGVFGSEYSRGAGNLIYKGVVGGGLVSNDRLANASANELAAVTAGVSIVVGTGMFAVGEAVLGVGSIGSWFWAPSVSYFAKGTMTVLGPSIGETVTFLLTSPFILVYMYPYTTLGIATAAATFVLQGMMPGPCPENVWATVVNWFFTGAGIGPSGIDLMRDDVERSLERDDPLRDENGPDLPQVP